MTHRRSTRRPFNPFVLQLPEPKGPLKIELYIEGLGYVINKLLQEPLLNKTFNKDELYGYFHEYLLSKNVNIRVEDLRPRSTNDLRRLDIVRVSIEKSRVDYLTDWYSNRSAIPGRSILALRSIRHLLCFSTQGYYKLGALALATSILVGETPCINVSRLIMLGMYSEAEEYVKKIVVENNPADISIKEVVDNIEKINRYVFTKAFSIVKETNLTEMLFKIYGVNLELLKKLLSRY